MGYTLHPAVLDTFPYPVAAVDAVVVVVVAVAAIVAVPVAVVAAVVVAVVAFPLAGVRNTQFAAAVAGLALGA